MTRTRHVPFLLFCTLLISTIACNALGGDPPLPPTNTPAPAATVPEPTATPLPAPTDPPATATPDVDPLAVSTLEEAREAVIQIEAQGSFVDPQVGLQMNVPGRGSGFIIDQEGHAVTNNHVVTGAALLRVWVGGEDEPRNARVLAVSECSDLALIDLEGDGYRYLEWYEEEINPGLDIYAAGFPLGDPEYTLTRGIVSKAEADGESDWASVDRVLEHDATINPGNSGGPLITADGRVVGINYAGSGATNQYFAISRAEALSVLEQLAQEQDVTSIGVNGMAVSDGDLSGIWVSSVESGSPADRAGIAGGDIITMMEDFLLATDGTMADYCDILRSHGPDDVLSVQVLRFDTEEVLEGQLNGDPLERAFSFAQTLGDEVGPQAGSGAADYEAYTALTDDSGALTMEVPTAWDDVDGAPWRDDNGEVFGASLMAAPDVDGFWNSYGTPGALFIASTEMAALGVDETLNIFDFSDDCVYEGQFEYEDALYAGAYDFYSECGEENALLLVLAALPEDGSFATLLLIQALDDADLAAADHILATFIVTGDLPGSSASAGGSAPAGDVTLEVINQTGQDIWYLYISPSDSDSWGEDWLGDEILFAGDSTTFSLPPGTYDLGIFDADQDLVEEVYEVVVEQDSSWTFTGREADGSGSGQDATLTVVNETTVDIWYLYISPTDSSSWGEDWLGDEILFAGDSTTFSLPPGTYDLAATDADDTFVDEVYAVDVEGEMTWTLGQE